MKFYSVRLKDSDMIISFSEYDDAKRFVKEIDFLNKFTIEQDKSKENINLDNLEFPKHSIDSLEVEGSRGYNFIYSSVYMSLDSKNHDKFKLEMHPIQDMKSRLEFPDKTYYSIIRRDKGGNFKSKSEVYVSEEYNRIKVDLYIPVGKFTEYVTGRVIAERLFKQIEKYRNIYFSNKFSKIKKFENQYNLLKEDLKNYFIEKEHGEQIIESGLKLLDYTKEKTKRFPDSERIKAIKKVVEQIKGVESNSLFLLELISDLIRESDIK